MIYAHQSLEATPLNLARPDVPEELAAVVAKMMAKEPDKRYQKPLDVAQVLSAFIKRGGKDLPPKGSPDSPAAAPRKASATVAASAASLAEDRLTSPEPSQVVPPASTTTHSPFDDLDATSPLASASKKTKKRRTVAVALALALLVPLVGWLAVTILRVETPNGTLIVEMNDGEVETRIKNGKLILSGPDGKDRYTLTANDRSKKLEAGPYKIRVEGADGLVLDTPEFTLRKDDRVTVRVTMAPKAVVKNTPVSLDGDRKAAEYVLSIGGIVRVNDEGDDTRAVAELPKEPFRLTNINLIQNKKVRNAALACFQDCNHLRDIHLGGTPLKDQGLAYFKHCKNLESLVLYETWISDVGLADFKDCKNLKILSVGHTIVSDEGLAYFKDCKNLRHLDLNATKVTEEGLAYFSGCKNLTNLYLYGVPVTGDFLAQFTDFSKLANICLNFTKASDASLSHLHNCKNLGTLQLSGTPVTDKGMVYLKDCKNLTVLWLEGTQVTDAGLAHLKDCKKLSGINLKNTKVTAAGIEDLKKALPTCGIDWEKPNKK